MEAAIRKEEKILQKSEQVLSGLQGQRRHQEKICGEARRALHCFRVARRARINRLDAVMVLRKEQMPLTMEAYAEGVLGPQMKKKTIYMSADLLVGWCLVLRHKSLLFFCRYLTLEVSL